jgi:hypothetical protein
MSFLSRKPARPGSRGGDAGRDDEYDDYDGYAHDGYQSEDDGWSPNEYFSPEGIKGRWAGENPEGRAGGRGQRDNGRGSAGPGYDTYGDDFNGDGYGGGPGYGPDEFATGAYDLPEGADDDRPSRPTRRRRRDREDSGERTGILRLRRDRGEDIWPDDGISDEDYWASVAADRPLNGADAPFDNFPGAGGGPGGPRPGMDAPRPAMDGRAPTGGADSRFGGEQRGAAGRLGPAPGLAGDYKPGAPGGAGALGGGRAGSGPMPARPGTGPQPARPGTGPTPTVGVTSSRPPAGQSGPRPGLAAPGTGSSGFGQTAPRPSFQPNGHQSGGAPASASGRPQGGGDWDRTERIERVNASGYPDSRPASRSQAPGSADRTRSSGPLGAPTSYGPGGPAAAAGRGRPDNSRPDNSRPDTGRPDTGRPELGRLDNGRADNGAWAAADRREPGRDASREVSGAWSAAPSRGAHARAADDDPLTSTAYSRSAQSETDGRSYRVAARRSQAQVQLTEQAETFITGGYQQQQPGQHPSGRTGEYWQYRDDTPTTITPAPAGRYQGPGGQGPGNQGHAAQGGHHAQPSFTQASPAQPANPGRGNPGRPASAGLPSGQYDSQQPRPQQRQQPQQRQLPAGGASATGVPTVSLPAAGPASSAPPPSSPPGARQQPAAGGLNPYDSGATGSYPYPARPAPAGPVQDAADDRYYRPSAANGQAGGGAGQNGTSQNGTGQGRADQSRAGYGNGYPANGDRRY